MTELEIKQAIECMLDKIWRLKIGLSKADKTKMANDIYNDITQKLGQTPKGVRPQAVIEAFEKEDGIWIAEETGYYWFWDVDTSKYIQGQPYQAVGIADGSITGAKISSEYTNSIFSVLNDITTPSYNYVDNKAENYNVTPSDMIDFMALSNVSNGVQVVKSKRQNCQIEYQLNLPKASPEKPITYIMSVELENSYPSGIDRIEVMDKFTAQPLVRLNKVGDVYSGEFTYNTGNALYYWIKVYYDQEVPFIIKNASIVKKDDVNILNNQKIRNLNQESLSEELNNKIDNPLGDYIIPPKNYVNNIAENWVVGDITLKPNLSFENINNGVEITKTIRKNADIYIPLTELPQASASKPITYSIDVDINNPLLIKDITIKTGATILTKLTNVGNHYSGEFTYNSNEPIAFNVYMYYDADTPLQVTNVNMSVKNAPNEFNNKSIKNLTEDNFSEELNNKLNLGDKPINNNKPIKVLKTFNSALWSQGCCFNTKTRQIIGLNESTTPTGLKGFLFEENTTGDRIGRFNHNWGHCSTADYNEDVNMLITTGHLTKKIHFIDGDRIFDGATIDIDDLTIDVSSLMNPEDDCGVCFGETSNIIYLFINREWSKPNATEKKLIKLFMGKGTNNLGSGTFASGKQPNEYNGTYKILNECNTIFDGELQGLKYNNGYVILSSDTRYNNILTPYLMMLKMYDNDPVLHVKDIRWIPNYNEQGEYAKGEAEGVCFIRPNIGYVVVAGGYNKTYKFEL